MSRKFNKHNKIKEITLGDGQRYRLQKIIDPTATNIHHVLGQSLSKEYVTWDKDNKMKVNMVRHNSLNHFYGCRQDPASQLKYMLEERREPVLSDWVKEELYALLSLPRGLFYKEHLVKENYRDRELFSDEISHFYKKDL